jgi:hypothetical protein
MTAARKFDAKGKQDVLKRHTSLDLNGPPQRL